MGSFSKTERRLRMEDNKRIVEELVSRLLGGEHINKRAIMKEFGITKSQQGWARINNLFNHNLKRALKDQGFPVFRCMDRYNTWNWWLPTTEIDFQTCYNNQVNDIESRISELQRITNQATIKGFQLETKKTLQLMQTEVT